MGVETLVAGGWPFVVMMKYIDEKDARGKRREEKKKKK